MKDQEHKQIVIENITSVLQKIQDNTIPRPELGTFDMREHKLYWELGVLVKQFVDLSGVLDERISDFILKNLKDIERQIRNEGKRKGKKHFPTWIMENKVTKQFVPPKTPWVQICWEFVDEYQDEERWNLVADLSGNRFKDNNHSLFTRKFAEDVLTHFSKKSPSPNAEELQAIFIKEISKFDHKPSRESEWEPLIRQVFGKARNEIVKVKDNFNSLFSQVDEVINEKSGTKDTRNKLLSDIGKNEMNGLRSLMRLVRISDEKRFAQKSKQLKFPKKISSKHNEAKQLYQNLIPLLKDNKARNKLLKRITPFRFTILNNKLKAITSDEDFEQYLEDEKLRDEFFN